MWQRFAEIPTAVSILFFIAPLLGASWGLGISVRVLISKGHTSSSYIRYSSHMLKLATKILSWNDGTVRWGGSRDGLMLSSFLQALGGPQKSSTIINS